MQSFVINSNDLANRNTLAKIVLSQLGVEQRGYFVRSLLFLSHPFPVKHQGVAWFNVAAAPPGEVF
jgi:hypothetical protein